MIMSLVFRQTHCCFTAYVLLTVSRDARKARAADGTFFGPVKRVFEALPLFFVAKNHAEASMNGVCHCYCCKYFITLYIALWKSKS